MRARRRKPGTRTGRVEGGNTAPSLGGSGLLEVPLRVACVGWTRVEALGLGKFAPGGRAFKLTLQTLTELWAIVRVHKRRAPQSAERKFGSSVAYKTISIFLSQERDTKMPVDSPPSGQTTAKCSGAPLTNAMQNSMDLSVN